MYVTGQPFSEPHYVGMNAHGAIMPAGSPTNAMGAHMMGGMTLVPGMAMTSAAVPPMMQGHYGAHAVDGMGNIMHPAYAMHPQQMQPMQVQQMRQIQMHPWAMQHMMMEQSSYAGLAQSPGHLVMTQVGGYPSQPHS
jgi:hypothetical protein